MGNRIAIVGMDAHFGGFSGLAAFARSMYDGLQHFIELPENRVGAGEQLTSRSHGAYITRLALDTAHPVMAGSEARHPLTPHLLLSQVVDNALHDAHIAQGSNVGVLLVIGGGLATNALTDGSTLAQQIAALWGFTGPAQAGTGEHMAVFHALHMACSLLTTGKADAVVVGAIDLAGSDDDMLKREGSISFPTGTPTLSYDRQAHGVLPGEGAGAIVIKRYDQVQRPPERVYAVIDALTLSERDSVPIEDTSAATGVASVARQAFSEAGVSSADIGYLEVWGSGVPEEDAAEIQGLNQAYQTGQTALTCAIGSVKANIGYAFAASGMASLIRTALCLYGRYIPAVPRWEGPAHPVLWENSPFYVATESHPWFCEQGQMRRVAAINALGPSNCYAHLVLVEDLQQRDRRNAYMHELPLYLYPLPSLDQDGLMARLTDLEQRIEGGTSLQVAARECFDIWQSEKQAAYTLVLVAQDQADLRREIERARSGVATAFANGNEWKTPVGSYFTVHPLGRDGRMAFVYPGAFNAYIGLGRDLFQLFPTLYDRFGSISVDMGLTLGEKLLYPRSLERLSDEQLKVLEVQLLEDSIRMLEIGTSFAFLYTQVMRDCFGVCPDISFGYSQGESAMMHALGVWVNGDATTRILRTSPLYQTRLSGPKDTVREFWGINGATSDTDDLWANYILMASAEKVQPHLHNEPHVYLAINNAPDEVMIAGDPAGCRRVIAQVKCRSLRAPFNHIIHSPPVQLEYDEFVRINTIAVHAVPGVTFYSAANYAPIPLATEAIAQSITQVYCQPLDFVRLVRRVYEDGARIFIELGPARNCSRWIDATLKGQDHVALSINKKGTPEHISVVRVLAQLVSHQVNLDLSPLYADVPQERPRRVQQVQAGPLPLPVPHSSSEVNGTSEQDEIRKGSPGASAEHLASLYQLQQQALHRSTTMATTVHDTFLRARQGSLQQLNALIQQYMDVVQQALEKAEPGTGNREPGTGNQEPGTEAADRSSQSSSPASRPLVLDTPFSVLPSYSPRPAVIDEERIRAFALGSPVDCFGEDYTIYAGRRLPLIPNGDLQLMSRIVELQGKPYEFTPDTYLVSEYDVPVDAWFYQHNAYPALPYSLLMEIALQPCGFLSAYLRSCMLFPNADLYFRNLDGRGRTFRVVDIRGKTITNHARLLSSTFIQGIIIQKLAFHVSCEGQEFYEGDAVFGYFTTEAMTNQLGLDGGKSTPLWYEQENHPELAVHTINLQSPEVRQRLYQAPKGKQHYCLSRKQLDLLDQVMIIERGGRYQQGYIYASKRINPDDWFFACHFKDDPVMPGSLGVEGMIQAMQVYALHFDLGKQFVSPHFEYVPDHEITWRYRGQIVRESQQWSLEVHIRRVEVSPDQVVIVGDASLWRTSLRIYDVKQIAMRIVETPGE